MGIQQNSITGKPQNQLATSGLVKLLKENEEDFEWYPTTDEMIQVIKNDIDENVSAGSILDIGAGDGRVLKELATIDGHTPTTYAIEKSIIHTRRMPANIFLIGTDFHEQTLLDKRVDVVVSNPPYSEYEQWASKIILETTAKAIYLIIPTRWRDSKVIKEALEHRRFIDNRFFKYVETLYTGSFENGERKARAEIDIIKINSSHNGKSAFDRWFDASFKFDSGSDAEKSIEERLDKIKADAEAEGTDLIKGGNLVESLCELYDHDMESLISTFKSMCNLNGNVLNMLGISSDNIQAALKLRLKSLKDEYWTTLFKSYSPINARLTASSRERINSKLIGSTAIDFTRMNCYAITEWVIKNANDYLDSQLVEVMERLLSHANIAMYKSNKNTWDKSHWRYTGAHYKEEFGKVMLDYRSVYECGGIYSGGYKHESVHGLKKSAAAMIDDLCAIARNLGFDTENTERVSSFEWERNKQYTLHYYDHEAGENKVLFKARAYLKGTTHIQFNSEFILKLNVQYGKLKGWVKDASEAYEEMAEEVVKTDPKFKDRSKLADVINEAFGYEFRLSPKQDLPLLSAGSSI